VSQFDYGPLEYFGLGGRAQWVFWAGVPLMALSFIRCCVLLSGDPSV